MNSVNRVRKWSRATSWTQPSFRPRCGMSGGPTSLTPSPTACLRPLRSSPQPLAMQALELVVNNSQYQGVPGDPAFRDLTRAASFRNLQHRLADRIFDWAQVGAVHLQAPPYYENVRALVSRSVAEQSTVYLPWGEDTTVIPLVGAEDVSRVAAALLANPGVPSQNVYPLIGEIPTVQRRSRSSGESDRTAHSIRGHHGRAVGRCGEGAARSSRARSSFTSLANLPQG